MGIDIGDFIGGAAGGVLDSWVNYRFARRMQDKQFGFQERMANTQWQRTVNDMRAAGINPALAFSKGPNAAPGGSAPGVGRGDSVSSAIALKRIDLENQKLDKDLLEADARIGLTDAQTKHQRVLTEKLESTGSGPTADLVDMVVRLATGKASAREQKRGIDETEKMLEPYEFKPGERRKAAEWFFQNADKGVEWLQKHSPWKLRRKER